MLRHRNIPDHHQYGNANHSGIISKHNGLRVLPDLPTAILAMMRGYVLGSYPEPLSGVAAEIGYHPLQSASPEELRAIQDEMETIIGG